MGSWSLSGNALGTSATGFLGTIDNNALVIKTGGPPTERLRVDTSGNVGIGTTSPQKPLDVAGSGGLRISQTAEASSTNEIYFADNGQIRSLDDNHRIIFNRSANELELREFGTITLSPGAEQGQRTAQVIVGQKGVGIGMLVPGPKTGLGAVLETPTMKLLVAGTESTTHGFDSAIGISNRAPGGANWYLRAGATGTATPAGGLSIADDTGYMLVIESSGNVGIGTTSPPQQLSITAGIGFANQNAADKKLYSPADGVLEWMTNNFAGEHGLAVTHQGQPRVFLNTAGNSFLNGGNVGIGTLTPASALHVIGDVTVTGDVLLSGADCAEDFDAVGTQLPEAGTVMVIDEGGALVESCDPYDKKVAGVVSGGGEYKHALVLDKQPSDQSRVPLALVGKVYCKVDAQYSPIEVGDLLTTSSTPGHATKAADPLRAFGSVIGKALKAHDCGKGLIPILVSLQ